MSGLPKRYVYKVEKDRPGKPRSTQIVDTPGDEEPLTHQVQGQPASDLEERFARALDKNPRVLRYDFQSFYLGPTRNSQGTITVDFMVESAGQIWPVQVDGEYAHKTQSQRDEDAQKDQILNQRLGKQGIRQVQRIPSKENMHLGVLDTQESADRAVEIMF